MINRDFFDRSLADMQSLGPKYKRNMIEEMLKSSVKDLKDYKERTYNLIVEYGALAARGDDVARGHNQIQESIDYWKDKQEEDDD